MALVIESFEFHPELQLKKKTYGCYYGVVIDVTTGKVHRYSLQTIATMLKSKQKIKGLFLPDNDEAGRPAPPKVQVPDLQPIRYNLNGECFYYSQYVALNSMDYLKYKNKLMQEAQKNQQKK